MSKKAAGTVASAAPVRKLHQLGAKALSWLAFGCAIAGGAGLPGIWAGKWIAAIVGIFPGWVGFATVALGAAWAAQDLYHDMEPNVPAIWAGILLPTIAAGIPERLGEKITELSGRALELLLGWAEPWLGDAPQVAVPIIFVGTALILCRRSVGKGAH
jgi:hypothetical protein